MINDPANDNRRPPTSLEIEVAQMVAEMDRICNPNYVRPEIQALSAQMNLIKVLEACEES